jgi:hypothetical protein
MRVENSNRALIAVVFICLGVLSACDKHPQSANVAKSASDAQPLFTPVAASLAQQKVCDEQAEKRFHEEQLADHMNTYTSRYDPTVNVCYIRIHYVAMKSSAAVTDVVFDAFGGRSFANYVWMNPEHKKYWEVSPSICEIDIPNKPKEICKSSDEFDDLTEKYFGVTK